MKLFNFDTEQKAIETRCGLNNEEVEALYKHLYFMMKDNILDTYQQKTISTKDTPFDKFGEIFCVEIPISPAELAQAAAEHLDCELTPELGFLVGVAVSHIKEAGREIFIDLIKEGKIRVSGVDPDNLPPTL